MTKTKLSIIIVAYRSADHLGHCVDSINQKCSKLSDWEIIIVNNDENQDLPRLSANPGRIKTIDHKKNIGLGQAVNLGAKHADGEIFLFLNPDARIQTENIGNILDEFATNPDIGIIGSGIIDQKENPQEWNSGKELSLYDLVRNNLGISRSKNLWNSRRKTECDWVSGAAMFTRRDLFERLQGFDGRFFMYFEDMDFCKRARLAGKKIVFFPDFKIVHGNGESYDDKKKQKMDYYDSMEKYFQKHCHYLSFLTVKFSRKFLG